MIPDAKACISKPCVWNVPQTRDKLEKIPVMELKIKQLK